MNCPYKIVVEPDEYKNYNEYIHEDKILVLPEEYLNKNQGGIPARNFIWEHASSNGFKKHWILDDNIDGFLRWNYNTQKKVNSGVVFKMLEDYTDRYENIGLCAMSYFYSIPSISVGRAMIIVNSRAYSCILINNELLDKTLTDGRWLGRYNEDTDLTIRVLQSNLSTFLFNNILSNKKTSGTMKGGNTDSIYDGGSHNGYQLKYDELKNKYPDIVKLKNNSHKDGRPHHHINYSKITNSKPILKEEYKNIDKEDNEYNMVFMVKEEYELMKAIEKIKICYWDCKECGAKIYSGWEEECSNCNINKKLSLIKKKVKKLKRIKNGKKIIKKIKIKK